MKSKLTPIQRKRAWLYFVERKKEQEIAAMENVSHQAISRSIKAVLKNLKKSL